MLIFTPELIAVHCSHSLLHPTHYLVIELMHSLVLAYTAKDSSMLTRPQMERKVQLAYQVIEVRMITLHSNVR